MRHPGVDKISFTGSTAAGRRIASICGERIARCTLELGGKSAAIILDDYDLDARRRADRRSTTCFLTGQVCSSLTRLIVAASATTSSSRRSREPFSQVQVGDPVRPDVARWARSR